MKALCRDLGEEQKVLDAIVADLDAAGWRTETPFEGWQVRDQIYHLAYFDTMARLAVTDAAAFNVHLAKELRAINHFDGFFAGILEDGRRLSSREILTCWRKERGGLLSALALLDPKARLPWYGPPMSARSFASARLMETWAHGQDIVDALGGHRPATPVYVALTGPSGDVWTWGPADAANVVRGSAEDFCLVVTRRRHVADTAIFTDGDVAGQWMQIAQAFAGPPVNGPERG